MSGVYFHLQKAFNTVNHEILIFLGKIYQYGIRGIIYNSFVSYPANIFQFTTIDNVCSILLKVTCGVPLGSVLAPLLFLLYVFANDTENGVPGESVILLADDNICLLIAPMMQDRVLSCIPVLLNIAANGLCNLFETS